MPILGVIASNILKKVYDFFNRTDNAGLGKSDSGNTWELIRGSWTVDGDKAISLTPVSTLQDFSMAAVQLGGTDATAIASVSVGTGVAVWISDSGSWWAATSSSAQESYNCNCSTCYNSCYCSSCASCRDCSYVNGSCRIYSCSGYTQGIRYGSDCYHRTSGAWLGPASCTSYNQVLSCGPYYACAGTYNCNPYSCNCATCYTTKYYLNLKKSVGGVVSQVLGPSVLTSEALSIKLRTYENNIVIDAYNSTTEFDPNVNALYHTLYQADAPAKGSKVGIIKTASPLGQNNAIYDFKAET